MHVILHKLHNGGVGCYPPNPKVVAVMMGQGFGWDEDAVVKQIKGFMEPGESSSHWDGFSLEFATEWVAALAYGGLTESQALDLFTRRIQARRGYTVSAVIDNSILPSAIRGDRRLRKAVVWDDAEPSRCRVDMDLARTLGLDGG